MKEKIKNMNGRGLLTIMLGIITVVLVVACLSIVVGKQRDAYTHKQEVAQLKEDQKNAKAEVVSENSTVTAASGNQVVKAEELSKTMLPEMKVLYDKNQDIVGWLSIAGTQVDCPVMQTLTNEDYYLNRGFDKKNNKNGSLLLDTESSITKPSTNLVIHGHNMKSGEMFGSLDSYLEKSFFDQYQIIQLKTLTEVENYQIIAVFYSQVYPKNAEVFKYYKFFDAKTDAQFQDFYKNIKALSLYDTGVSAKFGDEFITLSTCSYQVENGRFVVVGKKIVK